MENKTPYPMLANRILRKAKRAEIAMDKQRKQSAWKAPSGMLLMDGRGYLAPELPKLPYPAAKKEGYDISFSAPMSFSVVYAAAGKDEGLFEGLSSQDVVEALFAIGSRE